MGNIINVRASNDLDMFQMFKSFVHQTEKNGFFVDGSPAMEKHGLAVDFRNIEHTYEMEDSLVNGLSSIFALRYNHFYKLPS